MSAWVVFSTGLALGLSIGASLGILITALLRMVRDDDDA